MRVLIAAVVLIIVLSEGAVPSPEAALGARFADLYSSFAPLYNLYRSYADHLFTGAPVVVPSGISDSCAGLIGALSGMSPDLLIQSPSASLVRLRMETAVFSRSYRETLAEIERSSADALPGVLDRAGEEGLFASIYGLNEMLAGVFSQTILALGEGVKRWEFAVAFAARTIIDSDTLDRIDEDLRGIFYGEGGSAPPVDLPEQVSEAMASLIALSGRQLTEGEASQACYLAEVIECYFVFASLPAE